ncbi:sigma-70 family RNA polymerase sigma factor [Clostridium sp.]|uniref:sigma-70 family RNA polymerase sigma factor n=1 Tax=Clostridium sp. TaxID=1506 RepID=UPI00359F63F6
MKINRDNVIFELRKRNTKALEFIVDTYGGLIKSIVVKILFNFQYSGSVEECINDIFLAIWNNIDKFHEDNSLKSFISAIARYKAIDYQRKLVKELNVKNIDDMSIKSSTYVDKKILEKEIYEELLKLLSNLKPKDKDIFIKKYFEDENTCDIAKKLNVRKEVVNNRLSRGRKKLRKIIFGEVSK